MIVRVITVKVKGEYREAFKAATTENHLGSIQEAGILRFDVLQSETDPDEFLLYEVYESEEATLAHKETPHYRAWKERVEPMMAAPRGSSAYSLVAPNPKDY